MRIIVKDNYDDTCYWLACYIKNTIIKHTLNDNNKRPFILGLPTGSSPIGIYKYLIDFYNRNELSFKNVITFNMDEYVGLSSEHPQSYNYFMWNTFFNHIDIPHENVNILQGIHPNMEKQAEEYEEKIKSYGGIDLMLGGLGEDAHIAFNEPGSSFSSVTRLKTLNTNTINANSRFFDKDETVPKVAITMGIQTIMDAKEVCIIVSGEKKASALKNSIGEGINQNYPASILQFHKKCCFVVDEDATDELKVKTVKYYKGLQKDIDCMGNSIRNNIISEVKLTDNVLILSPHPDDDVIGMGAILQALPNKQKVNIAYMTSGENGVYHSNKFIRETEAVSSLKTLGYDKAALSFLKLPFYYDKKCTNYDKDIDILSVYLKQISPRHIFICSDRDPNGTHEKCFNIIKSTLTSKNKNINELPDYKLWAYKGAWGQIDYSPNTYFFPYDDMKLDKKIVAIQLHLSQFPAKFPGNIDIPFDERIKINNKSDMFPLQYEERFELIENMDEFVFG